MNFLANSLLGLIVVCISLSSCTPKTDLESSVQLEGEQLFSNRGKTPSQFIGIVTLKTPPLLEFVGRNKKGELEIDQNAVAEVKREQANFETNLPKIAPSTKIIYTYRFVLNGYAVHGSYEDVAKLKSLGYLSDFEASSVFAQPTPVQMAINQNMSVKTIQRLDQANSVKFIGAGDLHAQDYTGKGLRVGIIDTGVDYTHSMMGGNGDPELFKQIDGSKESQHFPNSKVIGGMDFVGADFAPGSLNFVDRIPVPDPNPIDEAGHGTHVAGTVAGVGDGGTTYSGVAPDAELYALKVFGKGSTADFVVTAAFEYAIDPNQDMNMNDRLDIVNLSLGGAFGGPKILYGEVIQRIVKKTDMIVVGAAGNSGAVDYITGAPATVEEALSVAASIDNSFHNWQLPAIKLSLTSTGTDSVVAAPPSQFGKPFDSFEVVSGELIDLGLGNEALTGEALAKTPGKIALVKRGGVPFLTKAKNAEAAGAIAVIVYNDRPEAPFPMGGEGSVEIPVVMVALDVGLGIIKKLGEGETILAELGSKYLIEKPEVIDTVTEFSSKGPRSDDLLIKPEISAPGEAIQSALMGSGTKGVQFSGTSMAAPHLAGVMALLKQAFPKLSAGQLKSLVLNTALPLQDQKKEKLEMVTRQGAGRVQVDQAVRATGLIEPATLSFGLVQLDQRKRVRKKLVYTNLSNSSAAVKVGLLTNHSKAITLVHPQSFLAPANKTIEIHLDLDVNSSEVTNGQELDGWVTFESMKSPRLSVPFLMVPKKISGIQVSELSVFADKTASQDAAVQFKVENHSNQKGRVQLFNLLGKDGRKEDPRFSAHRSKNCDIQSVGYRIVSRQSVEFLQLAVKLYNPVTHWSRCEVVALIDASGNGEFDQELGYITAMNVPGLARVLGGNPLQTASVLFNSAKIQQIRTAALAMLEALGQANESYVEAIEDAQYGFGDPHSTVVILEARTAALRRQPTGQLSIKVASQDYSGLPVEFDDFFNPEGNTDWLTLSLESAYQGYKELPEMFEVPGKASANVELIKGAGSHELMVLMPDNVVNFSEVIKDEQQTVLRPSFW